MLGKAVDGMIRRSLRARFHNVYWHPPATPLNTPCILCANHHGWFDGYIMYSMVTKLGIRSLDWITEFAAFPLFAKVGGMPFPANDPHTRAATVKKTIRLMRTEQRSLILFGEGTLHYPHKVDEIGKSLRIVQERTGASVYPVSIVYEHALHERPEAFLNVQPEEPAGADICERVRASLQHGIATLRSEIREGCPFDLLAAGTPDVNERWDMRRRFGRK